MWMFELLVGDLRRPGCVLKDGRGQSALVHLTALPHAAVVGEHIHPQLKERYRVISDRHGTRVHGVERTLVGGPQATAPAGTAHDWWNAGKDEA
jgi:hypothetical protein